MADHYAAALALLKQLTELHTANKFSNAQELLVPLKVCPCIIFVSRRGVFSSSLFRVSILRQFFSTVEAIAQSLRLGFCCTPVSHFHRHQWFRSRVSKLSIIKKHYLLVTTKQTPFSQMAIAQFPPAHDDKVKLQQNVLARAFSRWVAALTDDLCV